MKHPTYTVTITVRSFEGETELLRDGHLLYRDPRLQPGHIYVRAKVLEETPGQLPMHHAYESGAVAEERIESAYADVLGGIHKAIQGRISSKKEPS